MESKRFPLPSERGCAGCALMLVIVFTAFVPLAVSSLTRGMAVVASLLWLVIYGLMVAAAVKESRSALNSIRWMFFTAFGRRSLEAFDDASGVRTMRLVTRLAGITHVEMQCPLAKVTHVFWRLGEASRRTPHDMDDWCLCIRFIEGPSPCHDGTLVSFLGDDVYLGTYGKRERAQQAGLSLVDWLSDAGVHFVAGTDTNDYVRRTHR